MTMTSDLSLKNMLRVAARKSGTSAGLRRLRESARKRDMLRLAKPLAAEFGTSAETMRRFIERFAPRSVLTGQFREDADTMLFVHIPKTAGVSVGKALQQSFDTFHGVEWNRVAASFREAAHRATYEQSRRPVRQVIMGHFGWNELSIWKSHELQLKCGTIIRDPVGRLISNYNYNCSEKHPARENFMSRFPSVEAYADNAMQDLQLTQAIGFVTSFDEALAKLTRHYTFIGVTERLSDSLAHLSRSHGLPPIAEYRENAGTPPDGGLHEQLSDRVRARNHNDVKIHALMMRLYDAQESF